MITSGDHHPALHLGTPGCSCAFILPPGCFVCDCGSAGQLETPSGSTMVHCSDRYSARPIGLLGPRSNPYRATHSFSPMLQATGEHAATQRLARTHPLDHPQPHTAPAPFVSHLTARGKEISQLVSRLSWPLTSQKKLGGRRKLDTKSPIQGIFDRFFCDINSSLRRLAFFGESSAMRALQACFCGSVACSSACERLGT